MTLTLVLKKRLYHLPFKSYGQCKSFSGQTYIQTDGWTNGQVKNYMPQIHQKVFADKHTYRQMDGQTDGSKTICPRSINAGA